MKYRKEYDSIREVLVPEEAIRHKPRGATSIS